MKNLIVFSKSRFLNLHHAFVLIIMIAYSGIMMNILNGCSAGPDDGKSNGTVTTTIYGRIIDEAGKSIQGVSVAAGSQTSLTDGNGIFILKNVTVPEARAVVIAKKTGYFDGARAEAPGSKGITRMQLSMMSNTAATNVSGMSGGTVNITGGASVKFDAGSFTDASGKAYTGAVSVAARYLDPAKPSFYNFFSGDEEAQRTDGSTTNLVSCGVIRVELRGTGGEALNLDPTKPATLTCPKPADPKAPNTIQLWSFDESLGKWKEEGTATLQGSNYVGTVTHFTDYNFDYCSVDNGTLEFRIVCNTAPIGGVVAQVLGRKVISGPDGIIHIRRVAADGRPVEVSVLAADNGGLYYLNTPKSVTVLKDQTSDAGDITLDSQCPAELSGILTGCDDSKTEGLVTISDGININYIYTRTGSFAVQAPPGVTLTVDVMDPNGNQGTTVTVPALTSSELRDIGSIKICGTATSTYIDITLGSGKEGQRISLSPDGSRLATWSYQPAQFTVYDTKTGNVVSSATPAGTSYFQYLEISADNSRLLLSSYSGDALLYDISGANGSLLLTIPKLSNARLYDDNSKIIGSMLYPSPSVINVYSTADGSIIKTLHPTISGASDSMSVFGLIRDENSIIYPDQITNLNRILSVSTDAEIRNFPVAGNSYTFLISDDGLTSASSADNITFSCYDTKTGVKSGDVKVGGVNGTRYGNPFVTKNFAYIADQVSGANVIRILKIADGTSIVKLFLGATNISSIAASRNEQYLAAAGSGTIRIWKLQ